MTRDCTLSPSRPASGESLMVIVTAKVGGSIGGAGTGSEASSSISVSATVAAERPAIATMSPASASPIGTRLRPRNARSFDSRARSTSSPSRRSALTTWPVAMRPDSTRPVSTRPRNGS